MLKTVYTPCETRGTTNHSAEKNYDSYKIDLTTDILDYCLLASRETAFR